MKRVSHGEITQNTLRSDKGSLKVFESFLTDIKVTYLNKFEDSEYFSESSSRTFITMGWTSLGLVTVHLYS